MTEVSEIFSRLAAEFPREQISWRAQSVTKEGDKALALAYIDARDVMDRLDAAVGAGNWSDTYDVHEHVTICTIALRIDGGWTSKSDGAGDTDVEAEKGRISDAFKRAAVKWGVGRYLYAIPSPWVPCDSYAKGDKMYWKKWKANPWDFVKLTAKAHPSASGGVEVELSVPTAKPHWSVIYEEMKLCTTVAQLNGLWQRHSPIIGMFPPSFQSDLQDHYHAIRTAIEGLKADPKTSLDKLVGEGKAEIPFPGDDLPQATRDAVRRAGMP